jgi:adenylate cyclase
MDANDYYLQGKAVLGDPNKLTADGNDEARGLFEKAIELDPKFAPAYAELAYVHVREYQEGWTLKVAEALAKKALDMSHDDEARFDSHWNLGSVYWNQGEFDKSIVEYQAADRLKPNNADLVADWGEALIYAGDSGEAINKLKQAFQQNPDTPYWYWWNLGRANYMLKQYQEAIDAIAKITDPPNDVRLITAASQAQRGDPAAARTMAEFSKNDPEFSIAEAAKRYFRNDTDRQHWLDGLRKAGLKEY